MNSDPMISVVLPGYNEADNIETMIGQVTAAMTKLALLYEIIYVDDGSTDDSRQVLQRVSHQEPALVPVYHIKNFGQSAAILSGIQLAKGELVVTMDSDLQNDPVDIAAMIDLLRRENADAVCGVRQRRQDSPIKLFSSRVANAVRRWTLKDNITDAGCGLRVIKRDTLRQLPSFKALHRFLPTILIIHGYKVIEMPVCHHARAAGVSKYGVGNRLWVGLYDLVGLRWYRKRFMPVERIND